MEPRSPRRAPENQPWLRISRGLKAEGGQWSYDHAHQQLVQGDPDEDRLHVQSSALIVLVGHGHVLHCIILYPISNIPMICPSKIRITQKKEYNNVHNHS